MPFSRNLTVAKFQGFPNCCDDGFQTNAPADKKGNLKAVYSDKPHADQVKKKKRKKKPVTVRCFLTNPWLPEFKKYIYSYHHFINIDTIRLSTPLQLRVANQV